MHQVSSRIFIRLKQFSTYLTLFLCFSIQLAQADIGETYTLKQERNQVLSEIRHLQNDSLSEDASAALDSLRHRILLLDDEIFASYDQTISRIAGQNLERSSNDKLAVYLAMATTAIALFFALMLVMARSRIKAKGTNGLFQLYRQLTLDLIGNVSHEKVGSQRLLRVNAVVLVGLVMMSLSILAYLLTAL